MKSNPSSPVTLNKNKGECTEYWGSILLAVFKALKVHSG